jgi:hypothetical protein
MSRLKFFTRDSAGDLILASYHNPRSITWRWLLAWCTYRPGFPRKLGLSIEPKPRMQGLWRFGLGPLGYLYFARQEAMWRDA